MKEEIQKSLVYLDFKKNVFKFFSVSVLKVHYNHVQVILREGFLGNNNKGRETVKRFEGDRRIYKEAYKYAWRKIYEKENEGYISRERAEKGHETAKQEKTERKKPPKRKKPACSQCKKTMPQDRYDQINEWGRGEGGWDETKDLKGKVLCIDCQIEKDVFRKRLNGKPPMKPKKNKGGQDNEES
ncbi:hypothetical protein IMZ31_19935 (plasmid) [Pontibacillus sp. ALD_SL1]|uniref:hypothetical protein n=1 Tax=Pontibacillus sp. ALD_SL1 TaxID=2777185 RepID=UPI001A9692D2|nr:hypothetical protein [Pontibacillus sp. ALD_SL1]QST02823.1 hypothetical protein IMZ31_19935 [Pontibacillus sp. ALD_SL1]